VLDWLLRQHDDVIDEGCTSDSALTAASQTAAKVTTALDAVIDVSTKNTKFEGGLLSDGLVVQLTSSNAGFAAPTVDVTKQTITINGDFSYADSTDSGTTCSASELAATLVIAPADYTSVG